MRPPSVTNIYIEIYPIHLLPQVIFVKYNGFPGCDQIDQPKIRDVEHVWVVVRLSFYVFVDYCSII